MLLRALKEKKNVVNNFIALAILQGTNFLIPLIILPYLNLTVGINGFGLISFVQVVMIFFSSFTEYGHNVSATREVTIHQKESRILSEIFNRIMFTKILLLIAAAIILFALVKIIPKFALHTEAYLYGFTIVVGQTLLPVWMFQGMEKMKYLTYLNLIAKFIFTALIFIFVKEAKDYTLVLLFFGLGNLVSGVAGVFLAKWQFQLNFFIPSKQAIQNEIRTGFSLFLANFSVISYINSNVFILGLFVNETIVGYYSIVEKIIFALRQLLVIFSQAIYPQICQFANESHHKILEFYRKIFLPFIAVIFMICLIVFFFAGTIISFFAGDSVNSLMLLLKLLCFVPVVVGLNIPAYQTLLAYRKQNSYMVILTIGSVLNVVINLVLSQIYGAFGTAYSVIITELFITLGLHLVLQINHPSIGLVKHINR